MEMIIIKLCKVIFKLKKSRNNSAGLLIVFKKFNY